jgi:hypothetical protein
MTSEISNASQKPTTEAGDAAKKATVDLTDELEQLRTEVAALRLIVESQAAEIRTATFHAKKFLHDDAVAQAITRAAEIGELYQRAYSMMTVVETVIYALWRARELQQHLSVGDAALRLVQLMGHGAGYFQERDHWSVAHWIRHLADLTDADLPNNIFAAPPRDSDE